jgi:hypothetical protein
VNSWIEFPAAHFNSFRDGRILPVITEQTPTEPVTAACRPAPPDSDPAEGGSQAAPAAPVTPAVSDGTAKEDMPRRGMEELAAELRRDAADDPVFYLIRSNTCYDGE